MKKLLEKLKKLHKAMEAECEKRQEYYDDKSEGWQDSSKGCIYENKTGKLEDIKDDMKDFVIDELESCIDEE